VADFGTLLSAAIAPFLLLPAVPVPPRVRAASFALALLPVVLFGAALATRFHLVEALFLYGLRVELSPLSSARSVGSAVMVATALFGFGVCVLQSLATKGPTRLVGYGLILIFTSGHQVATVGQLVLGICGLLAVALGSDRAGQVVVASSTARLADAPEAA
jgi:hypothetical protein